MRIALVGQPNCGKSTLFNQVAGYKAHTGNFPGTTVAYTESKVRLQGEVVDVVDLPGTYTLAGTNPAERVTLRYLASTDVDVIINVLDATHLSQGLDMTLELLELQRPLILAVNLLDEADRLGLRIDGPRPPGRARCARPAAGGQQGPRRAHAVQRRLPGRSQPAADHAPSLRPRCRGRPGRAGRGAPRDADTSPPRGDRPQAARGR